MSDPRDVIIEPIVSEKSYALLEQNVYTFRVHPDATKPQIHDAVEQVFNVRAPGSIGASATPSRVFKGLRGPGRMGGGRVTQRGLTVVEVMPKRNLMLVRGAVPGPRGGVVEVRTDA